MLFSQSSVYGPPGTFSAYLGEKEVTLLHILTIKSLAGGVCCYFYVMEVGGGQVSTLWLRGMLAVRKFIQ